MTNSKMQIDTSAELMENDILPKCNEVHTDPNAVRVSDGVLPKALAEPAQKKALHNGRMSASSCTSRTSNSNWIMITK